MQLSSHFITLMAYVQGLERVPNPVAAQVHEQVEALIAQARDSALRQDVDLSLFQAALFPVVAWMDERLARLPAWRQNHDWRGFMLQRKMFATSHAGVQFFERLQALEPGAQALREVYLMCLGLGFVGRYSQEPGSAQLAALREEHYRILLSAHMNLDMRSDMSLFPEAYRVVTGLRRSRLVSPGKWMIWGTVIVLPVLALAGLWFWSDQALNAQVLKITKGLLW